MNVDIAIYRQARRESPQPSAAMALMAKKRNELAQQQPQNGAAVDKAIEKMDETSKLNRFVYREPGQGTIIDRLA